MGLEFARRCQRRFSGRIDSGRATGEVVHPAASLWEPGVSHEGYIRCAETVLLRGGLCDRTLNLGAIHVAEAAPEGHDRIAHCALVVVPRLGEPGVVRNHQVQRSAVDRPHTYLILKPSCPHTLRTVAALGTSA